jgi:hypothetical protein
MTVTNTAAQTFAHGDLIRIPTGYVATVNRMHYAGDRHLRVECTDGTSWIAANCQALTGDGNGIKVTSRATGHAYLAWAYGTSHMTARSLPLAPGDRGLTLTNERFAEEFQIANF